VNVIIAFEIAHNGAGAVIESRVPALLAHLPAHAGTAALRASKRERERERERAREKCHPFRYATSN